VAQFSKDVRGWHGDCSISSESKTNPLRRVIMKFENIILHSLFAACFLVCVLTIGAMITATPSPVSNAVASHSSVASATFES
jgi:hypothetical protein